MQLKLRLNGKAEPFADYLKSYSRIRESLLLEIDTEKRAFVAKTFTEDKAAIRFASLTFDEANIQVVSDNGETERAGKRIKVGILIQLKKLIQIVDRFGSEVDKEGKSDFEINIDYEPFVDKDKNVDFVSTQIQFKSNTLKMKMDGFRITELAYLSDEVFANNIFNLSDPVSVEISPSKISDIVKISDIIKLDPRKDALVFFVDGKTLSVKNQGLTKEKEPDFELVIGELDSEPGYVISLPVNREKFIKMMDKSTETFKLILGRYTVGGKNDIDRILFDSINSTTKIIIGGLKDS